MEIVQTSKGEKIIYDAFLYTRKAEYKTTIRWECAFRKKYAPKCLGSLTTCHNRTKVISLTSHNHQADAKAVGISKAKEKLRNDIPKSLYQQGNKFIENSLTQQEIAGLHNIESTKRFVRRLRRSYSNQNGMGGKESSRCLIYKRQKKSTFSSLQNLIRQPMEKTHHTQSKSHMNIELNDISINKKVSRTLRLAVYWRKTMTIKKSTIDGLGVFTKVNIQKDKIFLEYVGEKITHTLANKREKVYQGKKLPIYMFALDDNYVIDATKQGNVGRFINSSCVPNAYSKIIPVLGVKKIFIVALRPICGGEEITIKYMFNKDEPKLVCKCNADNCTGSM